MPEYEIAKFVAQMAHSYGLPYLMAAGLGAMVLFGLALWRIAGPLRKISQIFDRFVSRGRDEISLAQAREIYKVYARRFRGDLSRLFRNTLQRERRRLSILERDIRAEIDDRVRQIFEEDLDGLSNFRVSDRRLSDFHRGLWAEINALKIDLLDLMFRNDLQEDEKIQEAERRIKIKTDAIFTSAKLYISGMDSEPLARLQSAAFEVQNKPTETKTSEG
jgi:hypothetical protein